MIHDKQARISGRVEVELACLTSTITVSFVFVVGL